MASWWGDKRLDYCLYAPEAVDLLPDSAIPPFLHGCFWESDDLAAFIARQVSHMIERVAMVLLHGLIFQH